MNEEIDNTKIENESKKTKKYLILTYGCQMNEADSEKFAGQLRKCGYEYTATLDCADLILLNTCCVRESAEKKIYGKLGELKKMKAGKPNLILAIAGCLAQKDRGKFFKKAPYIDLVLGTHNIHQLAECVHKIEEAREPVLAVWDQAERLAPTIPTIRDNHISAWVPIMYGCNNFCTYCIVPYVRGRERSRPMAEIVNEITQLGEDGFKEITLLGQNVNSYGKDSDSCGDFADLLQAVDKISSIERIRYMTSHPRDMNDKIIAAIQNSQKVCEHFHLPIQSGSNTILKRMNRGYTSDYYRSLVQKIRRLIPQASITTDLIVGFPGETEELFLETIELVQEVRFDAAYTFLFSVRSGTPAATMEQQVPLTVKKERLRQLMDIQNGISLKINQSLTETVQEVLVEGASKTDKNKLMGRTRTNKIIIWDRKITDTTDNIGSLIPIRITAAQTWVLKGQPVS